MKTANKIIKYIETFLLCLLFLSCHGVDIDNIAPTNFKAGRIGASKFLLSWDEVSVATSYTLYYKYNDNIRVHTKNLHNTYFLQDYTSSHEFYYITAELSKGTSLFAYVKNTKNYYGELWYNKDKRAIEWTEYPVPFSGSSHYCLVEANNKSSLSDSVSSSDLSSNGKFTNVSYFTLSYSSDINPQKYYAVYVKDTNISDSYYQKMTSWVSGSDLNATAKTGTSNDSSQNNGGSQSNNSSQNNTEPEDDTNYDITQLALSAYQTGPAPEFIVEWPAFNSSSIQGYSVYAAVVDMAGYEQLDPKNVRWQLVEKTDAATEMSNISFASLTRDYSLTNYAVFIKVCANTATKSFGSNYIRIPLPKDSFDWEARYYFDEINLEETPVFPIRTGPYAFAFYWVGTSSQIIQYGPYSSDKKTIYLGDSLTVSSPENVALIIQKSSGVVVSKMEIECPPLPTSIDAVTDLAISEYHTGVNPSFSLKWTKADNVKYSVYAILVDGFDGFDFTKLINRSESSKFSVKIKETTDNTVSFSFSDNSYFETEWDGTKDKSIYFSVEAASTTLNLVSGPSNYAYIELPKESYNWECLYCVEPDETKSVLLLPVRVDQYKYRMLWNNTNSYYSAHDLENNWYTKTNYKISNQAIDDVSSYKRTTYHFWLQSGSESSSRVSNYVMAVPE